MTQVADFVIMTRGLTKSFGGTQVLRGVDLSMPMHSIFGFLGLNGAGKTILMKTLLGVVMGGSLIGGLIQQLMHVTPWALGKVSALVADGQPVPVGLLWAPLTAAILWSVVFAIVATAKFERMEFYEHQ